MSSNNMSNLPFVVTNITFTRQDIPYVDTNLTFKQQQLPNNHLTPHFRRGETTFTYGHYKSLPQVLYNNQKNL